MKFRSLLNFLNNVQLQVQISSELSLLFEEIIYTEQLLLSFQTKIIS